MFKRIQKFVLGSYGKFGNEAPEESSRGVFNGVPRGIVDRLLFFIKGKPIFF